ncbi:hypothetical protein OJAV_G00174520 [Oryzias javanicus]|uniref:Secretogranin II n=1 Tax=Oryzias javanicus TaxID=123683 RepID=A0A437CG71_ORYJA|nr:hypothetical protein OJAV_G00174520 [Oryzias javanicus]
MTFNQLAGSPWPLYLVNLRNAGALAPSRQEGVYHHLCQRGRERGGAELRQQKLFGGFSLGAVQVLKTEEKQRRSGGDALHPFYCLNFITKGDNLPIMLHFHHKLPAGGAMVLLALLLHGCAVEAASLPRHYRLRGGESDAQPASFAPSSDMIKALEYIENLKQRNGGRAEPVDYDEVEKFKVLLQLASQQDEGPGDRQPAPDTQRQDITAEQLMKAMLKTLQDQAGRDVRLSPTSDVRNDRRLHRHRTKDTEMPESAPADYSNFPRAHKKYPLMFEDEENADAAKRTTEDLEMTQ